MLNDESKISHFEVNDQTTARETQTSFLGKTGQFASLKVATNSIIDKENDRFTEADTTMQNEQLHQNLMEEDSNQAESRLSTKVDKVHNGDKVTTNFPKLNLNP